MEGWGGGGSRGSSRPINLQWDPALRHHSRSTQSASCRYPSERVEYDHLPLMGFCCLWLPLVVAAFWTADIHLGTGLAGCSCEKIQELNAEDVSKNSSPKWAGQRTSSLLLWNRPSCLPRHLPNIHKIHAIGIPFSHPLMPSFYWNSTHP